MGNTHEGGTLTDVAGLSVGHWSDREAATGCTVVLCGEAGAVAGVDVRGAAPGTRETDLLRPVAAAPGIHAVLLTGGSAYGLDAAGGVMEWLEEHRLGCDMGMCRVPLVCAAVIFDLPVGDVAVRPGAAAGRAACEAATAAAVTRGSVGAGTGATVGKAMGLDLATKAGLGSARVRLHDGVTVGAIAVVNALGDVADPVGGAVLAGPRVEPGCFADTALWLRDHAVRALPGANTTLVVVGTDAVLGKADATKLAQMGHDGLARTIRPVHTMLDGDTVFALGTGASERHIDLTRLGTAAVDAVAAAVLDAVSSAESLAGVPSAAEWRATGEAVP